jgi:hypothetical protein
MTSGLLVCYIDTRQEYLMRNKQRLTEAELAEIRRRRPGVRKSLACEGMHLTPEDEALFEQMDRERLTVEERATRIVDFNRANRRKKALAPT